MTRAKANSSQASLFREFLAKLLVLLLALQSLAPGRDASRQTTEPPPAAPQTASVPPGPQRSATRVTARAFPILPKGERPRYVPVSPGDPADPYVVAEASALNNNPAQIFAFVRDQIAFEAYVGSVRGARGTLWAMAGNTLDKASLLVALLGAAGYTAQYEHANISGTPSQASLILSMFPPTTTFVGCLPPNAQTDNPIYNPAALAGSADYYWVQYGSNGANTIALDPNVPGAAAGQSFQTPDSNFATVPASLRQQVTIKINAELYSQASALYGFGPATENVLTESFDASALVGNVITAGNLVSGSGGGGLDISAVTFTYTPFLLVGSGGPDISQDALITGTPYQEFYTSFPLGSQILTGLFLEVDADDYTYMQQPWTHTMFDRLGPAARQGNASVNLNLPPSPAPAVTQFDLTSVNLNTARQPLSSFQAQQTRLQNVYNSYQAIQPQLAALPASGPYTDAQQALQQQGTLLGEYLTVAENELITLAYDYTADLLAQQLDTMYYSRVYPNSPRLTIAATAYNGGNSQEMLDVLKNDMLVVDGPGQNRTAPYEEEIARGTVESLAESSILNQATGQTTSIGIGEIFGALGDPNLLTVVGPQMGQLPSNPQALNATTLSADAQTLILDDVAAGNVVIAPNQMVTVNGVTTVGWWETNPTTGHTVSHFVNGGHQGLLEHAAVDLFYNYLTGSITDFIGRMEGFGAAGLTFDAAVLDGVASGTLKTTKTMLANPPQPLGLHKPVTPPPAVQFFYNMAQQLLQFGVSLVKYNQLNVPGQSLATGYGFASSLASYLSGFAGGYYDELAALTANLPKDPDTLSFVSTPLGLTQTTPTPGTTPGVQIGAITVDPTYTIPIDGNSLPLVFDLPITNTGPGTDTFNIQTLSQAAGFQMYPTISSLTLAGGQSGMVNVCVIPTDGSGFSLPPVGQAESYSVTVSSATNGNVSASAQPSFNTPSIPAVEASLDPPTVATTPGGTVAVNLNLASLGNIPPGAVTLTVTPPTGITVTGLTSPVTVPLNGTATEALSISAAANQPGGSYPISLIGSYTAAGGAPEYLFLPLAVQVTPLGSCAVSSASAATQVGKTSLATDLGALASEMDAAAAAPDNPALAGRVVGTMNTILNQELTATYFQSIVPNLTAATNAVAAATPAALPNALGVLSSALCSIGTLLNQANSTNTTLSLQPSYTLGNTNLAVGPNQTAQWTVGLTNNSTVMHVYALSATGVPNGVTVQFSQPGITLPPAPSPYNSSNSVQLTLTTGPNFNTPFSFNVVATPEDAPNFAVSAAGTLLARTESVNVDEVTAAPPYANAGTPITISARVFSVVNETLQAQLQLTATDPSGHVVCCSQTVGFTLTPSTSIQTISFPAIDTTNFVNGAYRLSVAAQVDNIPQGAAAAGSLLIGSPLSGVLTANPSVVGPGSSTVQASLAITRDAISNPISTLVGTVPVNGLPRSMALYQNGAQQLAYVCSDSQVNIVDVTNTANPVVLSTFANTLLTTETGYPNDPASGVVPGFQGVSCAIYSGNLIVSYSRFDGNTTTSPIPTHFATYSLANPLSPVQAGSVVDIPRDDSGGLYISGNTVLMSQNTVVFDPLNSFVSQEIGDIWTGALSDTGSVSFLNDIYSCGGINPSTNACNNVINVPAGTESGGVCTPGGTTPVPNDPTRGGPYAMGAGVPVNSTTAYFASTNAAGTNIENPSCPQISGQLLVVDTTNPASPAILTQITDPAMAFMTGVAVQGNTAVAVGDSTGIYDARSGYVGTLVLSSFDISNPTSPQLLNSVTTQLADTAGAFVVPLGSNAFAVGNTTLNGKAELVLVDASNPNALRYVPYDAAFVANPAIAQGGYFFALSSTPASTQNALSIFQLSQVNGPQLSVSLQIPTTGNAALVAGSFNPAPSTSTPGNGSTTYTWTQPSQNTITFNMNLTGVNPGDVTTLVTSGELNYTLPSLGSGSYALGSLSELTQHILSISPASQTVSYGGAPETYPATIANPTSTQQSFNLSAIVPPGWSGVVPPTIAVAANSSQTFSVAITPPANIQTGSYTFNVAASTAGGISDTVPAALGLNGRGANLGNNGNTSVTAFTSAIAPSQVTVGQGDSSAPFTVTFTNVGNYNTYIQANSTVNLPAGLFVGSYSPTYYSTLSPNSSDTISGTAYANAGTAPGSYPVTIPVQAGDNLVENLTLTVKVSSSGVQGAISPNSGTTASSFMLTLTNTGMAQDTFALSVVGPLAQSASIQPGITLAAGAASQPIPIAFEAPDFIVPSNTQLQIRAVSQNDPGAQALIAATVTVGQTKSVTTAILPSSTKVTSPTTTSFLVNAVNTGNVADTYSAQITGATGPVTASLVNNGQSGPSISGLYLPARGTAQFPLNATVTGSSPASITVTVTSLSSPTVSASGTIAINPANACDVNQDGAVNAADIQLLIGQALGTQPAVDDLNLDGVVNVVDIEIDIDAALKEGCAAAVGALSTSTAHARPSLRVTASRAAATAPPGAVEALSYRLIDLGTLGGTSATARGLNSLGQVVGESDTGQTSGHAFLWEAGHMTDLGVPAGVNDGDSAAYGINDSGQAAGLYSSANKSAGFRYAGGVVTALSGLPDGKASAIGNTGQVVGSGGEAFLWDSGAVTFLGTLGGSSSHAYGINDLGQVVGSASLAGDSAVHAFLYDGAGLTDLETLGGTNSTAFGINDAGQVVGSSQIAGNQAYHAFIYSGGSITDLGTLGGTDSQAEAINRSGAVVGWAKVEGGERHAFVWTGRMIDVNSLVSPGAGVYLTEATAINDAGQIAANGSNGRAYLISLSAQRR